VGTTGAGDTGGATTTGVAGAVAASGASAVVAALDALVARGLATLVVLGASPSVAVATFLARFGFSATGSRFKPFSSA
jgi:hypothetical protein